jgi:transcriptional repressor NrdR
MHCPYCHAPETKVTDSRLSMQGDEVRRRRHCTECEERFTTYERYELVMPRVVKHDGSRENFDENKLKKGLWHALQKRPVSTEQVDQIISELIHHIHTRGEKEISSQIIGELVMEALKKLDHIAYVRFASVYRRFADLDAFKQEIEKLID